MALLDLQTLQAADAPSNNKSNEGSGLSLLICG